MLPARTPKKARRIEERTVLVLHDGDRVGLRRRPARGLLAGLWEFPAYEGKLSPAQTREKLEQDGFQVREMLSLRPAKHVFSHVEWHMTGYDVDLTAAGEGLTWVTPARLRGEYALPSAFRVFLDGLEDA